MSEPDDGLPATIPFRIAVPTWVAGWVGALIVSAVALSALGADFDDLSVGELAVASLAGYAVWAVVLVLASRRLGSGSPLADLGIGFRLNDLVWVPVGVVAQVWLIPWLYVPLEGLWPDTFDDDKVEERARELVEGVGTSGMVLLVVVVALAAPLVEEVVYRGLLQRSMARLVGAIPALVFTSGWFALVHPVPVEYPGLLVAGLVFGAGVVMTDRIGPGVLAHAAFNATGLVIVSG